MFKRVSKESVCPICRKPDWCLVAVDGAAICARVQSDRPMRSGVGWLHSVGAERSQWRAVQRSRPKRSTTEMTALAKQCWCELTNDKLKLLAFQLGVSADSLQLLRLGWSNDRHAYSFPMRDASGQVCGIRYRCELSGKKFSEVGGSEGMFYLPPALADYLVIVEGASDAAAVMTVGFSSVIGRSNNVGNVEQLLSIVRGHRFNQIVIVPDNDEPGQRGADALVSEFIANQLSEPTLLHLPVGLKDCRACVQQKKNARWLQSTLARLTQFNPKQIAMHEAIEHDK